MQRCTRFDKQEQAESWLKNMLRTVMKVIVPGTACAVFDIDGTILKDRGGDDNVAPLCNRMLHGLFNLCKELNIPVYIITARPEGKQQRSWTVDQLRQCGYPIESYVSLTMMPLAEWNRLNRGSNWNFSDYKFRERERIVQRDHRTIVLNAGDQWTDLLRVPPCSKSLEEAQSYQVLSKLPNSGVYVGSLLDLSWFFVKLPH